MKTFTVTIVLLLVAISGCSSAPGDSGDASTHTDGGVDAGGSNADAGATTSVDASTGSNADAGATTSVDASTGSNADAGATTSADASTGSNADAGATTSADASTGSNADAGAAFCLPSEVRQPGTNLCWQRCPLKQTWNGSSCEGATFSWNWCVATGLSLTTCTPNNPGLNACEEAFGSEYRLPTAAEYSVLLEETGFGILDGKRCDGGDGVTVCTQMFEYDNGFYWSSTPYDGYYAWMGDFLAAGVGAVAGYVGYRVRCLRQGP